MLLKKLLVKLCAITFAMSIFFSTEGCACKEKPISKVVKIANYTGVNFSNVVLIFEKAQGKGFPKEIEKKRFNLGTLSNFQDSADCTYTFEIVGYNGFLTGGCYYDEVRMSFDGYVYLINVSPDKRSLKGIKIEFTNFVIDPERLNGDPWPSYDNSDFRISEY